MKIDFAIAAGLIVLAVLTLCVGDYTPPRTVAATGYYVSRGR